MRTESPTVCHLQAWVPGKPVGYNSGLRKRARDSGTWWGWSEAESLRTRSASAWRQESVLDQAQRRVNSSFLFIVIFGPQQIGWYPPTVGRAICFAQFTDSHTDLFPNTLRATPRNTASPAIWAPFSAGELTCKINFYTRTLYQGICPNCNLASTCKRLWL